MRDKLEYTATIGDQIVTVTRYQPSNGKGLYDGKKIGVRKKTKQAPVDEQLNALEQLLLAAKDHDSKEVVDLIQASIDKRLNQLISK